ncbi:calaxin isoform X1 [Syngnathoides biaculeatus]|uniref:calaxin isoform X1 n=1 Tax=Syngnathoides biaculeatus TaxID=300417 RepID=UPI002ADD5040|nr:calaxin isoform X1 [Syngnathoides biaculeatus]XP_061676035.1 calaxin isoform X1 [Syngnathoides biaculeatus]
MLPARKSKMSKRMVQNLAENICKQVAHFNKKEAQGLIREFHFLLDEQATPARSVGGLDRWRLRSFLHDTFGLTNDTIMDAVFRTFDKDNDGFVGLREWIEGLAIVLRGTLDERIKYCFHVYDLNADKYISREEMLQMLRYSLRLPGEEDPYDGIKDLVEITLKRMDHDHDDRLSLDDFEKSVKAMNHMLEAFGNCLPNTTRIETFEQRVFQSPVHW